MLPSIFRRHPLLSVTLFFCLLAVVFTYPLVLHLGDGVVGSIGDNIYFVWLIRWYQKALFELHIPPLFNPWLNFPQGWNLSTTDTSLAIAMPGVLFSLLTGPTAGYNLAALLTFVLSGLAMYAWVRHLSGSEGAGLVAGVIYAFLPYRMAHFTVGHLNLMGTQWFPLYFWGLYDTLNRRQAGLGWRSILLAALGLGLVAFSSMYYLYMTLLVSVVFVGGYFLFGRWRLLLEKATWLRLAALAAACLPLALLALWPFFSLSGQGELADRSWQYASIYSASPTDFIFPPIHQWLLGDFFSRSFYHDLWIESSLYIGVVAMLLGGLAVARRRQMGELRPLVWLALLTALAAFVLALGTDLHWLGQPLEVTVPGFLQGVFHGATTRLFLPGYWLFNHLPFYSKMRALMRMGVFVLLFTTLLAGLGSAWLLGRAGPARRLAWVALLVVLVVVDFYPGPYQQISTVQSRPVDAWLAAQPGNGALAEFPPGRLEDQQTIYNTLTSQKPFIGGFFNANKPLQYQAAQPLLDTFPSMQSIDLLKQLQVQYVLVDSSAYPDFAGVDQRIRALGLVLLTVQENEWVYGFPGS